MLNQNTLVNEAANYKKDAKKRYDAALAALLALAWKWKDKTDGDFSFDANPELYDEALRICREMSDGCAEDAKKRLFSLVEEYMYYADEDEAWDEVYEDSLERFDMAGSHLIDLLNLWVAAAFANNYTKSYTQIAIGRYANNPFASGLFGAFNDALKWGRGYQKNIAEQLALIGQNAILGGARYADLEEAREKGATHYIRRRGSNYPCDVCQELANILIPIDEPWEFTHGRCVCYPEYVFENGEPSGHTILTDEQKAYRKAIQNEAIEKFRGVKANNVFAIDITARGIKEFLNQPHRDYFEKNNLVLELKTLIENATYLGYNPDYIEKGVKRSYIYESNALKRKMWLIVREYKDGRKIFYGCSDNPKIAKGLRK